jgi:hypothetical protein
MLVTTMEYDMHLGRYPLLLSSILFSSRALPDVRRACVVCRVCRVRRVSCVVSTMTEFWSGGCVREA